MSLAAELMRAFFGDQDPPPALWIGLGLGGRELAVDGYERRVVLRGSWRVAGTAASATSTFGPFGDGPVTFDEALVFMDNQLLQRVPFDGGGVRLQKGMSFEHETVIETSEQARG